MTDADIILSKSEQAAIRKWLEGAGTITDAFHQIAEQLEKAGWSDDLLKAAPFLAAVEPHTGAIAGAVGVATKLFKRWAKEPTEPFELGAIACSLAWQTAARAALDKHITSVFSYRATKDVARRIAERLRSLPVPEEANLNTFTFEIGVLHPFVQRAGALLRVLLQSAGVPEQEELQIFNTLNQRFHLELQQLLANTETAAKFEPFVKLMERGVTQELRARQALHIHAQNQLAQFAAQPLFSQEPFTLQDIYLDTECGELTWGQISPAYNRRQGRAATFDEAGQPRIDPFSENHGGRADLLQTVLRLLTDGPRNEPIVLQGFAGQGKSSFTLRLCAELQRPEWGFIPVRVRLKKLRLDGSLLEAMARAITEDMGTEEERQLYAHLHGFQLTPAIFNTPHGKHTHLSRYVLVLDGWDELEVSASETFREKVRRVLEQVRREFLPGGFACTVRVLVTGRPNPEVESSALLQEKTPVLTLRNLRPEQLRDFTSKLKSLTAHAPTRVDQWEAPDPQVFSEILDKYKWAFVRTLPDKNAQGKVIAPASSKLESELEVLGLPLLTYLTIRVMSEVAAQYKGIGPQREALADLVERPAHLYRCLTDLTCEKAGKAPFGDTTTDEDRKMARELGRDLRRKLRHTAAAVTASGQEHLSRDEWVRRLPKELTRVAPGNRRATEDDPFVKLMISFYFKGGHAEQGLEFAHKSFREYLFAEHIVETLKEFGSKLQPSLSPRPQPWRNFARDGVRHKLAQTLGELFAPQWLSSEVAKHLEELLYWEIARSQPLTEKQPKTLAAKIGLPNELSSLAIWEAIRDALADIWEWWTDEVHLRPVAEINEETREHHILPAPAQLWIIKVCNSKGTVEEEQGLESFTSVDAHVGEALFRLSCLTHYQVALVKSWELDWQGTMPAGQGSKRSQTNIEQEGKTWRLFCLSRENQEGWDHGFFHVVARINTSSGRPAGVFPASVTMMGVDLRSAFLDGAILSSARLSGASLSGMRLNGAILDGAILDGVILDRAILKGASLKGAELEGASLTDVVLANADLSGARLSGARLNGAILSTANLSGALLGGASLSDANLSDAILSGAILDNAILDNAILDNAILDRASLSSASLSGAVLFGASLSGARLPGAILDGARLSGAILDGAILSDAILNGAILDGTDLSDTLNVTVAQLESIGFLDEETKFPPGPEFDQLKQKLLQRQRKREEQKEAE